MAIPAVHALHQHGFDIHWVCGKTVQPLLECYSWIHLIPTDQKSLLAGGAEGRVRNIARLWREIIFQRYDICAVLYYDRRYRLLTLPVRAVHHFSLSRKRRATSMLPGRSHMDEYARVLLGTEDTYKEQGYLPLRPDQMPPLRWHGKDSPQRIAIVPGGAPNLVRQQFSERAPEQTLRRWPVERYVELAQQLLGRGWEVVLLGGPEDAWVKPYFRELAVSDCIGTLSLPEVILTCDLCDGVVSHDTGPLHLAGLSKACLVGIFGPTDPAIFLPRRPSVVGIWGGQGFACRPCYDGRDFAPCKFNGCMHQVTSELVLRELNKLLAERASGRSSPWRVVFPEVASQADAGLVKLS